MMKKGFIIFSGTNFRAAITLFRFFSKANIPFFVIAMMDTDPIFKTTYRKNVAYKRLSKKLDTTELIPIFKQLLMKNDLSELIVCPTSEYLNHFLLDNRLAFEKENVVIPLIQKETYHLVTNKYSFADFLKKYDVNLPKEMKFADVQLPFVAKPFENITKGKVLYPHLIFSKKGYETFVKNEDPANYFYQEYLKGDSYYLLYYFDKNQNNSKFSQKNLAQQPNGKSIVYAEAASLHLTNISTAFEQALQTLKYSGWIMIEVIKKNEKYYFIEANPRFWGPLKLVLDNAPHLFEHYYKDYFVKNLDDSCLKSKTKKYLWLGGFKNHAKKDLKWYVTQPQNLWSFLLGYLSSDVYFKRDSFRYFLKELIQKND